MIINQKIIKTADCNIDYRQFCIEIAPYIKQVYSPAGMEAVAHFFHADKIEFISDEEAFSDDFYLNRIKENFNCLKEIGDVLCFGDNYFLCAIPYNYIVLFKISKDLDDIIKKSKFQKELEYIALYNITKDLKYLDLLSKSELNIELEIFDLCKQNTLDAYIKISETLNTKQSHSGRLYDAEMSIKAAHDKKLYEIGIEIDKCKELRKNLVILHLESLSNEVYFNNRDKLRNLTSLMDSSMNFTRFYTSASSSIMSLFDLFYGNDFETDNYSNFKDLYPENTYATHLFQILQNNEYCTLGVGFNESADVEETNSSNVWNVDQQSYVWKDSFDGFLDSAADFISDNAKKKKPFAIHMWDLLTHSGHFDAETRNACTYDRKSALSFVSIDIMIKKILSLLKDLDILDNTIIVCYGDHGDDLWSRAMDSGFTHVTAPHSNLIWTPACIYDSRIKSFLFNNLASMVDLKHTILYLLGIDFTEAFNYRGINLIKEKNDFIYSRSLLHNQREYQRIKSFKMAALNNFSHVEQNTKAISIISDKYNLLVSNNGLEMYLYLTDPFNRNNLLNFIEFDNNFIPRKLNNQGAWRGHFRKIMMRDSQVYEIIHNLNLLREKLQERIVIKNKMITNCEKNLFNMDNFTKVRERGFKK